MTDILFLALQQKKMLAREREKVVKEKAAGWLHVTRCLQQMLKLEIQHLWNNATLLLMSSYLTGRR